MARSDSAAVYVAVDSFACDVEGVPYNVVKGQRVRRGHPLLAAQPRSFEPSEDHVDYEWETASEETATTPKRSVSRPKSD